MTSRRNCSGPEQQISSADTEALLGQAGGEPVDDGAVHILGIILGVIAGGGSKTVLLAAGFAAAITESISMGAVGWTSALSERDYYAAERARESAEIDQTPDAERQEVRQIYAGKGFTGDLLDRVVDTITVNREAWLTTMMDEELHLQPVE